MRIVLLLQDTGKVYGAERATLDLAAGLRAAGEEVTLLLIEETRLGPGASDLRDAVRELGLPFRALPVAGRLSRDLVHALRATLRDLGAEVLHTTGYKADLHGGWAAGWGRRWPVVSTVHGWLFRADLKEQFYGWLNLQALRRCARVIALSRHYEAMLAARGVPRERLVRIPSGLDPATCPPGPWPAEGTPFTIGLAGRLSEEKNHDLFLRAARRALDGGARLRFLLAGDGPLRAALAARSAELNLAAHVEMPGFLPREDFLSRVHAVALCSRIENLPYSILEAMAWSRPVLATQVGGLPDLVEDGVTGWLVPGEDEGALAGRMALLAGDPGAARRLGAAGRGKVAEAFSAAAQVAAHRVLYASVTRERRSIPLDTASAR